MSPNPKVNERTFALCYVNKEGWRPCGNSPEKIIGHYIGVYFGKKDKPMLFISSCTDDWRPVENLNYINSLEEIFLIAEVFYKIKPIDWLECHSSSGESLYQSPKSSIDKMHKKILKKVNDFRNDFSFVDYYTRKAYESGIV